jgi:hypothetical protein
MHSSPSHLNSLSPKEEENASSMLLLLGAGLLTVILWNVPYGQFVLYPFTILGTWFHEMGHGLTALLVGGTFHKLELYPNGSGVAYSSLAEGSRLARAATAAGGLIAPAFVGALLIILGKKPKWAKAGLLALGGFILLSVLIWVRSLFGFFIMALLGAAIITIAVKGKDGLRFFMVQFLGIQAWASMYLSVDYMFSDKAHVGGAIHLSDTAAIAEQLFLPYWVWGGLISIFALLLLLASLWVAFRKG